MFECKRCGKCCGIVPFTKKEFEKVRAYAKKNHIGFVKTDLTGKVTYFPKAAYKNFMIAAEKAHKEGRLPDNQMDNIVCPFLGWDEKGLSFCRIYNDRPEICRLFGHGGHQCLVCPNNPVLTGQTI